MNKNTVKKLFGLLLTSLIVFAAQAFAGGTAAYASDVVNKRSISVSGTYTVKVAPDIAYIDIAVRTFNVDAIKAQDENKNKMNRVMDQLKKLGIQEKDIRTVDYRIQPRYEWTNIEIKNNQGTIESKREQILVGYEVINNIKVTVNDLQKIGTILDLTVKEGINEANNITFDLSEATKTAKYLEALKGAVKNGEEKAKTIAGLYGISLSVPSVINESEAYFPSPIRYTGLEKASGGGVAYNEGSSTPISGGEMEIRANVSIIYEY